MPFENAQHHAQYRIYYEDTDAGGIVYHANYLNFAERARTDALRELAIHQSDLREEVGIIFVVRHAEITYLKPILLDDLITVQSQVVHVGNTSLKMRQCIYKQGIELSQMLIHIVCINQAKKPTRIPQNIIDKLSNHMMKHEDMN